MTSLLAPPAIADARASNAASEPNTAPVIERRRGPALKRGFQSVFVIALALYASLSVYLSFSSPIDFDPYKYSYHGWCWWTFNDLRQQGESHNVALLGSSLMMSAVNGVDANFLNKKLDLTSYHKASVLDSMLTTKFGGKYNTFNLATPGQMPSDAFMMLKAMVNTSDRPEVVIYGVAPRDFIDSTMSSPVDSENFHYLKRIINLDDVSGALFRNPISKLDFWLQRVAYFYQYSLDFEMAASESMTKWVERQIPPDPAHPFTYWDRVKLLPKYLTGEVKPLAVVVDVLTPENAERRYRDNTQEYIERYHRPDKHTYKTQFYFLKKLTEFCKREKIELIIVNMPLTRANVEILKPWWYLNYIQALREFSFYNNVPAFDLSDFQYYKKSDFNDGVHLNAFGGKKLMQRMINVMSDNERTATALDLAGKELERHQKVAGVKSNWVTPL